MFNDKKDSRFLTAKNDDEVEEDRTPIRETLILSRRSSFGNGH